MYNGPELPVIYENPRFDAATPTLQPVINRAIRFGGVMMMEWGTLTLIEDSPRYLKIATIVVAGLVLGVHESWPWLRMRDWRWYPALMSVLLASYAGIFAYALITEPHKPAAITAPVAQMASPAPPSPAPPVDKRKNPLDSEQSKWLAVSRIHAGLEGNNGPKCKLSIVRYQLPYAENFSDNLKEVFKVLDWPLSEGFATAQQPRGLSIKASGKGDSPSYRCAALMINSFNSISWRTGVWAGNVVFPSNEGCEDCVELDIGNDPEQQ